jgi:hypothetical protein
MSLTLGKHDQQAPRNKPISLKMEPNKASPAEKKEVYAMYKGFVAGVFSGVSKLTGKSFGHLGSISGD